ncbi:MAG: hypothetical protein AVDCRST_MAG02-15, partial [uncultured Rubrobacteraceae bacterium]
EAELERRRTDRKVDALARRARAALEQGGPHAPGLRGDGEVLRRGRTLSPRQRGSAGGGFAVRRRAGGGGVGSGGLVALRLVGQVRQIPPFPGKGVLRLCGGDGRGSGARRGRRPGGLEVPGGARGRPRARARGPGGLRGVRPEGAARRPKEKGGL